MLLYWKADKGEGEDAADWNTQFATRKAREQWADQFAAWQAELDDYGVDEAFDEPQTAALDG